MSSQNRKLAAEVTEISHEAELKSKVTHTYANSFNPGTTIRYGLSSKSHVTLTVFNTVGQQIASLVNGDQIAGYHEEGLDESQLASGVGPFDALRTRP